MHPMLHTAVRSVREGGRVILMYFNQLDRLEYSSKGRNDFVSQADIEAEVRFWMSSLTPIRNMVFSLKRAVCKRARNIPG